MYGLDNITDIATRPEPEGGEGSHMDHLLFPIWGSLLWELWEGSIRPLLVPRAEIDAMSAAMLVQHADRAEQMAFIQEIAPGATPIVSSKASGGGCEKRSSACVHNECASPEQG
jgi:hypothetical protein